MRFVTFASLLTIVLALQSTAFAQGKSCPNGQCSTQSYRAAVAIYDNTKAKSKATTVSRSVAPRQRFAFRPVRGLFRMFH